MAPNLRVLVIEDNPDDALLMERALKSEADVVFVDSGAEGVERAKTERFDVVVLDYRLGDLTGTEVMARLREVRQDLPVIVASGMGSHFITARTLALGAREFVSKDAPDFAQQLRRAVHSVASSAGGTPQPSLSGTGDVSARAQEVKKMIASILEDSDLVNTVGIVGADGALIHGHIKDKSGAEDVTAVLAGTVQMMLSTVANHLGYGGARSIVASYEKGAIAMASLPGNLALYFTSNAAPNRVDALRAEIEAAATELGLVMAARRVKK
jgi:CheY-like chemotaxis protein/predicted regulator of Ras-like GTPase activity (Roadblock/LC7/MglB family)